MKKNGFAPILIVLFALIVGLVGYFLYKNYRKPSKDVVPTPTVSSRESLVGIWQASGSMAAGWNDRYHFYSDGRYHFYPNQMVKTDLKEKSGTWKVENNLLILDGKAFTLKFLGIQEGDFYPSIMIGNSQYWQFSDNPTKYGSESFPSE